MSIFYTFERHKFVNNKEIVMSRATPKALETSEPAELTGLRGRFSPLRFLSITIGGIFLAEVIAMVVVTYLRTLPYYLQTLVDASIMVTLVFPIVYFLSLKPLINHIEKRQQAEAQLHEMALFSTLNPDAVLQVDATGQIIKSNPAAEQMGLSIGAQLFELIPDLRDLNLPECIAAGTTLLVYESRLDERVLQWKIYGATELGSAFLYSQDITEKRYGEEVIRLLSSIVEQTADTVVVTNREGVIEYINPALEKVTGYAKDDVLGKTPRVLKSGIHDEQFYRGLWDTILKGEVFHGEITNRKKDGELLHETKTITPLRDAQGNITRFVATGKDITERKLAEERLRKAYDEVELRIQERTEELRLANKELQAARLAAIDLMEDALRSQKELEKLNALLRESEERLNKAQEIAHLGSWDLDLVNNRLTWSDEVYRIFGLQPQQFGATYEAFLNVVHPDDRHAVDDAYSGSLRDGSDSYEIEHRVVQSSSGEVRIVHEKCDHFRNEAGQIVRSVGMVHDITERKRADEALRESEERFYKAFRFSPVGVNIFRLTDGCSVDVNDAFLELTGYSPEELVGYSAVQLDLFPDSGARAEWMRGLREQGAVRNIDTRIRKKNGQIANVIFSLVQIDVNSELMGLVLAIDITERKQAEEELYKLNRTLKALSNSNQALMHAVDEVEFLNQVCEIVVHDCGHVMVWVGYAEDDENKLVRPVASAGFEEGYLESLKITWADSERGRGPTGTAIRSGKPSRCRNMLTDPQFEPWRAEALKRGYASSIALPLMFEGKAMGALTIYSREPDPFSEDEERLLSELAGDLAYGITSIRLRQALAHTAEELSRARDELEVRVQERTEELAVANRELLNEIVERKEVERQLRIETTALEAAANGVIITDTAGMILWANPAFLNMSGYDMDEVVGTTPHILSSGMQEKAYYRDLWSTILGGNTWRGETINRHKDGSLYVEEQTITPVRQENGQLSHFIAIKQDITERKRAEDALRESEEKFRTLVEWTYDWEIWLDPRGNIIYNSPSCERITGYDPEEFAVEPDLIARIIHPDDRSFYEEHQQSLHDESAGIEKVEYRILARNGNERWIEHVCRPLFGTDNHYLGRRISNRDITEQKQVEEDLRERNQKEKLLIQTIHTMQLDIARDLHDTIGQNIGYLRMKLDHMVEKDMLAKGSDLRAEFSQMSQVANESYDLVRGTLAILQSQGPDDLLQLFKRYAGQVVERSAVKIEFTDQGKAEFVTIHQMRQLFYIFREALINIEKHSSASHAWVDMTWGANMVELSIRDNGKGFDPSQDAVGHYGLKFMRERTEMMKGSYQLKTEPGVGTQIIIGVPLQRKASEN
jgi:PAS domain S-box-containing protein